MNKISIKLSRNDLIATKGQIKLPLIAADELLAESKDRLNTHLAEIITQKTIKGEITDEKFGKTGNSEIEAIA